MWLWQVAEPPKIMCVVSFYFGSILALFYHPNSLQWTEIYDAAKFDAVRLLSQKLFLQLYTLKKIVKDLKSFGYTR